MTVPLNRIRLGMAAKANVTTPPPLQLIPDLTPPLGGTWTGAADGGWISPPTVTTPLPTLKSALAAAMVGWKPKPRLKPLFTPYQTVTGDVVMGFTSAARCGVAKVQILAEGTTLNVTTPTWNIFTDVNGVAQVTYGYHFKFKAAAWQAITASGRINLYATSIPNDLVNYQSRTVGPFPLLSRPTEFDVTLKVALTSGSHGAFGTADYVGQDAIFSALNAARAAMNATPTLCYRILCIENGAYRIKQVTTAWTPTAALIHHTVIEAGAGVTAVMGDATQTTTQPFFDGLHFRGSGIQINISQLSPSMGRSLSIDTNAHVGLYVFNGVEITGGNGGGAAGITGSGAKLLYHGQQTQTFWIGNATQAAAATYFTECNIHDMSGYGVLAAKLVRCSILDTVSGSGFEDCEVVHGCTVSHGGGAFSGLRTYLDALDVAYDGRNGTGYFQKGAGNGQAGQLDLYESGASTSITGYVTGTSGNFKTLNVTAVGASVVLSGGQIPVNTPVAAFDQSFKGLTKIAAAVSTNPDGTGTYTLSLDQGALIGSSLAQKSIGVAITGTSGIAIALNVGTTTPATSCADLATAINAHGNGWTASTAGHATNDRAAQYINYRAGTGTQYGFNNSVPGSPIYMSAVTGGAVTLQTILDIHSEAFYWHTRVYENCVWEFNDLNGNVENAHFSVAADAALVDTEIRNMTVRDDTLTYAAANPGLSITLLVGFLQGEWHHTCLNNVSQVRVGQFFSNASPGLSIDVFCGISRCVFDSMSWGTAPPQANMNFYGMIINYSSSLLMTGANAGNHCQLLSEGAQPPVDAATYMDTTTYVPVQGGTLYLPVDGTYVGAKVPASQVTTGMTGNYGWNLAA